MKRKRLLALATSLEKLANTKGKPKVRFDLNLWGKQRPDRRGKTPTKLGCATAACAVGHAMLMPEFRKQGLSANIICNGYMVPVFKNTEDFQAVEKFFDIEDEVAHSLFLPESYLITRGKKAEQAVAARIRAFVAGKDDWESVGK